MRLRQLFQLGIVAGLVLAPWDCATAQNRARAGQSFSHQIQSQSVDFIAAMPRKPFVRTVADLNKFKTDRKMIERRKGAADGRPKQPPKEEPRRPGARPKPDTASDTGDTKPERRPGRRPPIVVLPPPIPRPPVIALLPALPASRTPGTVGRIVPALQPRNPERPVTRELPVEPRALPATPPAIVTEPEFVSDEVLITVATAALPQLEVELAAAFNVTVVERTPLPLIDARLVRFRIPDGRAVPAVVAALTADQRAVFVQPNYVYRLNSEPLPTPVVSDRQPGLQYSLAKFEATILHGIALGRGTAVAVIDSGVDGTHPDFVGAQLTHFDATSANAGEPTELDPHGTGVAGIIAARGIVKGLAPGAAVLSARVFRKGASGSVATTEAILKGLTWSAEQGARVLNMSFAGPRDPLVERHLKVTTARGMLSVAAAGNNGARAVPAYPAAYDDVVAVTALDASDRLFVRANRGGYIAVAAPGVDVIVPSFGHAHHFQSGTSLAAAHVSAIAALLLEVYPRLSPRDLRELLISSADDLGVSGRDDDFGSGRVNAVRAIRQIQYRVEPPRR